MIRLFRRNWTIRGGVVTPVYKIILYYFIASKKTKNYHLLWFLVTIEQAETEEDIMNELEEIRKFFDLPQVPDKQKTEQKLKELDKQLKKRNWRAYSELSKGE